MAKILVDEDLVIGALMCCLGAKVLFESMANGAELSKELLEQSAGLIREVLELTPEDLRERVINAILEGEDPLEEVVSPKE